VNLFLALYLDLFEYIKYDMIWYIKINVTLSFISKYVSSEVPTAVTVQPMVFWIATSFVVTSTLKMAACSSETPVLHAVATPMTKI
jgi:hypothetical protein